MLRSARLTCLTVFAFLVGLLPASALACDATFVVRPGDTLASIAAQKLGSGNRFRELYELNQGVIGPDPNLVKTSTRLVLPCANGSQPERTVGWNPLPKPRDMAVAVRGGAVQLVDIRSPKAVAAGVIPGALSMPLAAWRGPRENPGRVPPVEVLAELIGGAGLRLDRPILIVGSSAEPPSMGGAAFVYWMLKSLGAKRIAILEGGHKASVEENPPLSNRARRGRPYTPA